MEIASGTLNSSALLFTPFYSCRKGGLLLNNVIGIIGAAGMGLAKLAGSYELLIFGRFMIGVNCGKYKICYNCYLSNTKNASCRA